MPVSYFLSPIPRWQFTTNDALYNVKGKLYTYRSVAHDEEKPVYQDAAGLIPYTNPIILDGVGSIGPIYWADDELYYIELRDQNGAMIWFVDHFPVTSGGGVTPISVEVDYDNQLLNGQFRFHNAAELSNFAAATEYNVAQGWVFKKDNATATDKVSFKEFLPGSPSSSIEGNPKYYFSYECTVSGTGESSKYLVQYINDVRVYSGKVISISLVGMANVDTSISVDVVQHFGTGGSPSIDNVMPAGSINLTTSFDKHSLLNISIDNLSGKTIGINKDDRLEIRFNLPLNQTGIIDLTNVQINIGDKSLEYQYTTPEHDLAKSFPNILERRVFYWEADKGSYPPELLEYTVLGRNSNPENWLNTPTTSAINLTLTPPAGSMILWATEIVPEGWLMCNAQYIQKWKYPRLYTAIGDRYTYSLSVTTATATLSGADVVVTMGAAGVVTHAADVNTGFTFTVVQAGTATLHEIFKITCTSGAALNGGEYFTFRHVDNTPCICWLCVDGNYLKKPTIPPGTVEYRVYVRRTNSANEIASQVQYVFNRTNFAVPDARGYFLRFNDLGVGRDPNRDARTPRIDGAVGGNAGTTQPDGIRSHIHNSILYTGTCGSGGTSPPAAVKSSLNPGEYGYYNTTSNVGDAPETRALNIYFNLIIKY